MEDEKKNKCQSASSKSNPAAINLANIYVKCKSKMKKVSTKNSSKTKRKGQAYKCDLCVRKFVSLNALKLHHRAQHNIQPYKSKSKLEPKQYAPAKKLDVKNEAVKKTTVMESPNTTKAGFTAQNEPSKETLYSEVEYECPRCFLSFNTYLTAAQHIEKFHYAGRKVPMNILPDRKELCLKCKRKVKSIPTHLCGAENLEDLNTIYSCLGCYMKFGNLRLFYSHVVYRHADGVESLFFPTNNDLSKWKQDMEYQTNGRYSQFVKVDSKCYAHCIRAFGKGTNIINICPSLIVLQEFPKGIQIHYYSHHSQHPFTNYKFINRYKKFSITSYLKASDSYFQLKELKSDDTDLYVQFKQLMESVVLDAAKLKKESLTILFGKALEMTSVLTGYDNEDDMSDDGAKPEKERMTVTDIEKALEEPILIDNALGDEPHKKKVRHNSEAPAPMILNSFSLANTVGDRKQEIEHNVTETLERPNIKVKDIGSLQEPKVSNDVKDKPKEKTLLDSTPSSFNESFAVFVEQTCSGENELKRRSKRAVMKTKIGQYKPPSPEKLTPNTLKVKNSNSLPKESPLKSVQNSPKPATLNTPKVKNNDSLPKQLPLKSVQSCPKPAAPNTSKVKHNNSLPKQLPLKSVQSCPKSAAPNTSKVKHNNSLPKESPLKSVQNSPKPAAPLETGAQLPRGKINKVSNIETRQKSNACVSQVTQKVKAPSSVSIGVSKITNNSPKHKNIVKSVDSKELPKPLSLKQTKDIKPKKDKPKVEIKYEVKEQKNDCNILILKI